MNGERVRSGDQTAQALMQDANVAVATPEIDARIDALRRNMDGLLQRFTDQHPDVVITRRLIADLEEQKRREVAQLRKQALNAPPGSLAGGSMVQQEMSRMLATAEVQVAALRARVAEFQTRYAQSIEAMKTAPQIEAELAQLNRDYAVHKRNYEDLVGKRESASMSSELDVASGVADFRLIDPPRVSPRPVSPNRFLLLAAGLAAALGVAVFTAFAASQLRPVFFDPNELRNATELPILGVVSRIMSDAELRRRRSDRVRVIAASGGLVLMYLLAMGVLLVIQTRQYG
jgi:polysaccharide chain length determinant protein (PEP-CTERM system associated)